MTKAPTYTAAALRQLEAEYLTHKIRQKRADADLTELELVEAQHKEFDRLAKPGINRVLHIWDALMPQMTDMYIESLEHWERRAELPIPGEKDLPLTISINTPGGSVTHGLALYDTILRLRRKGFKVITRGSGLVASFGVVLMQAGDERVADKNVQFLIHELAAGTAGKVSGIEDDQAMFKRLNHRLFDILAERSAVTKQTLWNKSKRKEWWLDAEEALKLGLVDRVE